MRGEFAAPWTNFWRVNAALYTTGIAIAMRANDPQFFADVSVPAFTIRTAHSSVGTPCESDVELIHIEAPTGLPVSLRTSIAHSISSQYWKY